MVRSGAPTLAAWWRYPGGTVGGAGVEYQGGLHCCERRWGEPPPSCWAQPLQWLGGEVIHTDCERGFIKAETISFDDYVRCKGEVGAKEAGLLRVEGRDYVCQDGDIFHFRFNV